MIFELAVEDAIAGGRGAILAGFFILPRQPRRR